MAPGSEQHLNNHVLVVVTDEVATHYHLPASLFHLRNELMSNVIFVSLLPEVPAYSCKCTRAVTGISAVAPRVDHALID